MTLTHRHLAVPPGTPPEELPLDALDNLLDRGDLDDWRALARALRREPQGALAGRIAGLCRDHEMYGTSLLWPAFIERLRTDDAARESVSLVELRRRAGKTQAEVAEALGVRQSDVSKLERRADVRLSTLRRYVAALGGKLDIAIRLPDDQGRVDLDLDGRGERARTTAQPDGADTGAER